MDPSSRSHNPRVIAEFCSYAFSFKLIQPKAVTAWADSLVAVSDVPSEWLMDLSLAASIDWYGTIGLLKQVPGESNMRESLELLQGLITREWRANHLTIGNIRSIGWKLFCDSLEMNHWGIAVDADGDAFDEGWITEKQLRKTIDNELERYEPLISLLPSWV